MCCAVTRFNINNLSIGILNALWHRWHKNCVTEYAHNSNRVQIEACLGASGYRKRDNAVALEGNTEGCVLHILPVVPVRLGAFP